MTETSRGMPSEPDETLLSPLPADATVAVDQDQEQAPEQVPMVAEPIVSAGMLLREARQMAGVDLSSLAVVLKVPVRKLQALEEDRHDELSGPTFTRALASSVCRALKMDPAPVLALLPNSQSPKLPVSEEGLNAPFHKPDDKVTAAVVWERHKLTIGAVAFLILAALVLHNLPQTILHKSAGSSSGVVSETVVPASPPAEVVSPLSAASVSSPAPVASAPLPVGLTPQVPPAAISLPLPIVAQPAASQPQGLFVRDALVFEAKADTWIEVLDSKGGTLIRRTLRSGERETVSANMPLAVSIGNVDKTRLLVRGRPFDLSTVAKDNVARFNVQ
jgi:cytoskeleton protein RodZ